MKIFSELTTEEKLELISHDLSGGDIEWLHTVTHPETNEVLYESWNTRIKDIGGGLDKFSGYIIYRKKEEK